MADSGQPQTTWPISRVVFGAPKIKLLESCLRAVGGGTASTASSGLLLGLFHVSETPRIQVLGLWVVALGFGSWGCSLGAFKPLLTPEPSKLSSFRAFGCSLQVSDLMGLRGESGASLPPCPPRIYAN